MYLNSHLYRLNKCVWILRAPISIVHEFSRYFNLIDILETARSFPSSHRFLMCTTIFQYVHFGHIAKQIQMVTTINIAMEQTNTHTETMAFHRMTRIWHNVKIELLLLSLSPSSSIRYIVRLCAVCRAHYAFWMLNCRFSTRTP